MVVWVGISFLMQLPCRLTTPGRRELALSAPGGWGRGGRAPAGRSSRLDRAVWRPSFTCSSERGLQSQSLGLAWGKYRASFAGRVGPFGREGRFEPFPNKVKERMRGKFESEGLASDFPSPPCVSFRR